MYIGVIGATGQIGQRVVTEALSRDHHVRAFTRYVANANAVHPDLTWASLDIFDSAAVAEQLSGLQRITRSRPAGTGTPSTCCAPRTAAGPTSARPN
jgi:uncharacterized protein